MGQQIIDSIGTTCWNTGIDRTLSMSPAVRLPATTASVAARSVLGGDERGEAPVLWS